MLLLAGIGLMLTGCTGGAEQHFNAGARLHAQGRLEEAIGEYTMALVLDPEMAMAYQERGLTFGELGFHRREVEDLSEAIRLEPGNALAYTNRGRARVNLGQFEKAISDYTSAIRLNPHDGEAFADRAIAYALVGMTEEAEADIAKAVELGVDPVQLESRTRQARGLPEPVP